MSEPRNIGVTVVPPPTVPDNPRLLIHHRWDYREPTACGLTHGCSSNSAWNVQCRDCLAALGVRVDDRTDKQKESDLAGYLWREFTK